METEKQTVIESHFIGGQGPLLSFIEVSTTFGVYAFSKDMHIQFLQQAAQCDDKESREFMLELINRLNGAYNDCAELRKRIETIGNAVKKINHNLKTG